MIDDAEGQSSERWEERVKRAERGMSERSRMDERNGRGVRQRRRRAMPRRHFAEVGAVAVRAVDANALVAGDDRDRAYHPRCRARGCHPLTRREVFVVWPRREARVARGRACGGDLRFSLNTALNFRRWR